jgi:hypothetical protein
VVRKPIDELLFLSRRNFFGEGVWAWFVHRSFIVRSFGCEKR